MKIIYKARVKGSGMFTHEKTSRGDLIVQGGDKEGWDPLFALAIKGREIISLSPAGRI